MHQKNKSKEGIERKGPANQNDINMGDPGTSQPSLEQLLQTMVAGMTLQQEVVQKQQIMQQEWMAQQMKKEKEKEPTKQLGPLPEYDGNREELDQWLSQARHKLEVDYAECSEKVKYLAIHNKLRGDAAAQLAPWFKAVKGMKDEVAERIFDQLELSFGDPHKKEKAARKLHHLRQGNRSFMEYFVEYRRLIMEAGGASWPEDVKKSYLRAGINRELQELMIGRENSDQGFESYCDELKRISDQAEAFQQRNRQFRRNEGNQRPPRNPTTPATTSTPTITRDQAPAAAAPGAAPDTMDWQPSGPASIANARRAKWVSKEELDKRRKERRCIRCGANNHLVKDCPYKPARPPRAAPATPAPVTLIEPTLDDEDNTSEESEN
jgi:hypothetical protein